MGRFNEHTLQYCLGACSQGWEKSIVIDIRLRYSLLFVHRMHWNLYFFECASNMTLSFLFFFFFSAQFDIPCSILFVQVTLSHFGKFKITVGMSLLCFCL